MKTDLHLFLTPFLHESRCMKQGAAVLDAGIVDKVVVAALWEPGLATTQLMFPHFEVQRIRLRTRSWSRRLPAQFIKYIELLSRILLMGLKLKPAFVNCHQLELLPLSVVVARLTGARLIYCPHELETEIGQVGVRYQLARFIERTFIRFVDGTVVVGHRIADWYEKAYGSRPSVVRNVPEVRTAAGVAPFKLREVLPIPREDLIFLYLGGFTEDRGLESLASAFGGLAGRHLVFVGYGPLEPRLREAAARYSNVHVLGSVRPHEVIAQAAEADIGLCLIDGTTLSYRYCLPNKLFESICAGIPVLASSLPEMADFVAQHDIGWVVDMDATKIREKAASLTRDDVTAAGLRSAALARTISWQGESQGLVQLYRDAST